MINRKLEYTFSFLFMVVLLTGCFGQPAPINVKYLKTVVNEDSSGLNTFGFAKPVDCDLLDFRPALNEFMSQSNASGENVSISNFNDGVDVGWEVTINFDSPEQIPAQIEGLKRSIVQTVKDNWKSMIKPDPDWDSFSATNKNEFSVEVTHPATTSQGKEWEVSITINPALLATPEADCSYPEIEYEIVMPGEIKSYEVSVKAYSLAFLRIFPRTTGMYIDEQLVKYATVQKTRNNTLLWVIKPKSIGEIILENDGIDVGQLIQSGASEDSEVQVTKLLYDHWIANEEERAAIYRLISQQPLENPIEKPDDISFLLMLKPIYTIKVNSATPVSIAQFVLSNITPIVVLIGGFLGAIYTILSIRQAISKRRQNI